MGIKGKNSHEVSRAFKQATGVLSEELEIPIGDIAERVGIKFYEFSRYRKGKRDVTQDVVDALEAAYPGFEAIFTDYLEGRRGWGVMTQVERDASVQKDIDFLKKQLELWQDMYAKLAGSSSEKKP